MVSSKQIVSGVKWTTIQMAINRIIGFVVKMVLARLLFPKEYGLIGMAVVFSTFFRVLIDLGFSSALIQRKDGVITQRYLSTAFWSNIIWSFSIFLLLLFVIAPFASDFYKEDILRYIIPGLGLNILTSPFYLVHRSLLARDLEFKKIGFANNIGSLLSGLAAVLMAYFDMGVWALVGYSTFQTLVELPIYYLSVKWRPSFVWNKDDFKNMFGFAGVTSFSGLVQRFVSQGDFMIVGKILGKIQLGIYSFAFILTDTIRIQIRMIIENVMYPVFCKTQDDGTKRENLLCKSIFFNSLLITPLIGVLIVSSELITFVFGEKWSPSLEVVKIISFSSIIQIVTNSYPTVMRANNLSHVEFKFKLLSAFFVFLPLVFAGTYFYGIVGCSYAVLLSQIIISVFNLYGLNKYLQIKAISILKNFFLGVLPAVISGLMTFVVFYFISTEKSNGVMFYKVGVYFFCVVTLSYIFNKGEIHKLTKMLKR